MLYRIFDTHSHYDDEKFDNDREDLLQQMTMNGVEHIVNVAASMKGVSDTVQLVQKYSFFYGALGVHPDEVGNLTEEDMLTISEQVKSMNQANKRIVAIGEIGLDYYWDEAPRELQKKWFIRQLHLAEELKLPMIVHSRDAAQDTYEIMTTEHAEKTGGVVHCFSYSAEMAQKYVEMGFYIGIGGVVTFKNGKKMKEVVDAVPLDRIVTETDCPYLAPSPNRRSRNDSQNIRFIIDEIANIKGMDVNEVQKVLYDNAFKLYRI